MPILDVQISVQVDRAGVPRSTVEAYTHTHPLGCRLKSAALQRQILKSLKIMGARPPF
jgi:hypothetical protein